MQGKDFLILRDGWLPCAWSVGRPPPGRAETAAEIQGDGQKQRIFRPESQDLCRRMTHLNSEVVSLLVPQRVEKIRFQYLIKRFRRFGGTIFSGGTIHSGNNREHLGRCSEPSFKIVRPLIWKRCTINVPAAQTDTTSQRTVPQAGVGTSRLCVKQLHGSESGWAVIRDSSWGRCGVGQLREGHLGPRQRCFLRDILTSCDPPHTLQLVSSLSSSSSSLPAPLTPVYQLAQPGQRPAGPQQLLPWLRGSLSGEPAERRAGGNAAFLPLERQMLLVLS